MEVRSKSTQERKQQSMRRELQNKFEWILNEKYASMEFRPREKEAVKQSKNRKASHAKLHPTIQKVESIQNMQLVSMKSAIHELQDLVTPTSRGEIPPESRRIKQRIELNPQSFIFEHPPPQKDHKDTHQCNKMEGQQNQTVQYYKEQNNKLKTQLAAEKAKNQEFIAVIKKLEYANSQLDKEINLLLHKWQLQYNNEQKISDLKQDFRQQLIINLQLEELLLKQKLDIEKKVKPVRDNEETLKNTIKELKHQLSQNKRAAEAQNKALKTAIESKDKEVSQLKEAISKLNEPKPHEGLTSLHILQSPSNSPPCNFMQRFSNFSKEMEAKLSQNIVSTNPSLRDTAMIELQANRKNSESEYSKGNCPSVEIPMLEVRATKNRPTSKTDRT